VSQHHDDPDRTPPQGFPRVDPRQNANWAAAEAQRPRHDERTVYQQPAGRPAWRDERVAQERSPYDRVAQERPHDRVAQDRVAQDRVAQERPPFRPDRPRPREDQTVIAEPVFTPDPDGFSVAPAVIGGELPESHPVLERPPLERPRQEWSRERSRQERPAADAKPAKRSFLGKLLRRDE
jgi:hypothetical protein